LLQLASSFTLDHYPIGTEVLETRNVKLETGVALRYDDGAYEAGIPTRARAFNDNLVHDG